MSELVIKKMPVNEYQMISDELISWRRKDMYIKWYKSNAKRMFLEHEQMVNELKARTVNNLTKEQSDFIAKVKILEILIMTTVDDLINDNNQCGMLLTELKNELDSYIK